MAYDGVRSYVSSATAYAYIWDGYCDDGSFGYDLTCEEFEYDGGDCGW